MSERLSITRVDVLERVKSYRSYRGHGLCYAILSALFYYNIPINDAYYDLSKIFPKFTIENAIPFGASGGNAYWWRSADWECGRMDFLNWLIEQYKDDNGDLREIEL